jgi:hypothetical protein
MALAGTNDEKVRKVAEAKVNPRIFIVSLLGCNIGKSASIDSRSRS